MLEILIEEKFGEILEEEVREELEILIEEKFRKEIRKEYVRDSERRSSEELEIQKGD